jgi:hypothetical protein
MAVEPTEYISLLSTAMQRLSAQIDIQGNNASAVGQR